PLQGVAASTPASATPASVPASEPASAVEPPSVPASASSTPASVRGMRSEQKQFSEVAVHAAPTVESASWHVAPALQSEAFSQNGQQSLPSLSKGAHAYPGAHSAAESHVST